jgi:hypothetical protein
MFSLTKKNNAIDTGMTLSSIAHQRLQQQHIAQFDFEKPEDVVSWMGAMQAQDYLGALWGVGLRTKNTSEAAIEKALADRTIIRTWPMRGTLHFVAPADARWMLKTFTPRVIARSAGIYRQVGLDKKIFTKSAKLLVAALEGGKQLTRKEVYEVLERGKIAATDMRGLHILGHLAQEGLICFGARKGKQPTFTLLEEWIPAVKAKADDAAMAEFTLRYFTSHGPATVQDYAWWTGLTATEAKAAHELVKSSLVSETIQGITYWMTSDHVATKTKSTGVYLLPGFDEYLVGYTNRTPAIDTTRFKQIAGNGNGILSSTIVINSQVVGTWKRTIQKETVTIETNPFESFTKTQKSAITAAAKRYSKFLDLEVQVG